MTQSSVPCGFSTLSLAASAMISFDMSMDMGVVHDAWFDRRLVFSLIPDSYNQVSCKIMGGKDRELFREMVQLC